MFSLKKIVFPLSLLFLAAYANWLSSNLVATLTLPRPPMLDIVHHFTPYIPLCGYLADGVLVIGIGIFVFWLYQTPLEAPQNIYTLALIYLARSILILLNPVGDAHHGLRYMSLFPGSQADHGMFPSGHTAFVTALFLMIHRISWPKLKTLTFALLVSEIAALTLARGHYSIDLVGAVLLALVVHRYCKESYS